MTTMKLSHPPTAVPCPHWCGDPTGHPYEGETHDGEATRFHSVTFGEISEIAAGVDTLAAWRGDAEVTLDVPYISVWIGGNGHDDKISTAEDARRLAAHLMNAADLLEKLEAQK